VDALREAVINCVVHAIIRKPVLLAAALYDDGWKSKSGTVAGRNDHRDIKRGISRRAIEFWRGFSASSISSSNG